MSFYICALPDVKGQGRLYHLISDDPAALAEFARKHDRPGYSVYRCVSRLKPNARRRSLDDVAEQDFIHVDIDCRALVTPPEVVLEALANLPLPLEIRASGGGFHVLALLKEPVEAGTPEFARVNTLRTKLTILLCGDPAPNHAAALLREIGTHNKKYGEPRECRVLHAGQPVDITEVETLVELYDRPLFEPKPPTNGRGPGDAGGEPRADVETRLAAVQCRGAGESGVHTTELDCINSRVGSGVPVDDAVDEVLSAVRSALATDPRCADWDWDEERRTIEEMAYSLINKDPTLAPTLPDDLFDAWSRLLAAGNPSPRIDYDKGRSAWYVSDGADRAPTPGVDGKPAKRPRFQLLGFHDLRPGADPACLVDELIPLHGIVVVWGKPKCLKTFFIYDLALHVARGMEYRHRRVQQGAVVYCAFEGAHGFKNRAEALRRHYAIAEDEAVPLYLVPGRADLIKEHAVLVASIREHLGATRPAMVALDTLNKSLVGNENSPEDMAGYIRAAEAVREAFDCVVLIIHHCGWDETRLRGHSSLPGAVDAQLAVVRSDNLITVTVEVMRDGPEGVEIRSAAQVVEVGQDDVGKILTSLVLVPTEAAASAAPTRGRPDSASPILQRAMIAALAAHGEVFQPDPGTLPVRAVDQEEVRKLFYRWYADGEGDAAKSKDTTAKSFKKALQTAEQKKRIRKDCDRRGRSMLWFAEPDAV